jgi:hypothetical protein
MLDSTLKSLVFPRITELSSEQALLSVLQWETDGKRSPELQLDMLACVPTEKSGEPDLTAMSITEPKSLATLRLVMNG